jgi:hypothetical protein
MLAKLTAAGIALCDMSIRWLLRHFGDLCLICGGILLGAWLF